MNYQIIVNIEYTIDEYNRLAIEYGQDGKPFGNSDKGLSAWLTYKIRGRARRRMAELGVPVQIISKAANDILVSWMIIEKENENA